jgi:hypothetical protein
VSCSLTLWSWLKLCSAIADLSVCASLKCLSCSLIRRWTDRPVCPMYTLPHSHGILYMPGVFNPSSSFKNQEVAYSISPCIWMFYCTILLCLFCTVFLWWSCTDKFDLPVGQWHTLHSLNREKRPTRCTVCLSYLLHLDFPRYASSSCSSSGVLYKQLINFVGESPY